MAMERASAAMAERGDRPRPEAEPHHRAGCRDHRARRDDHPAPAEASAVEAAAPVEAAHASARASPATPARLRGAGQACGQRDKDQGDQVT